MHRLNLLIFVIGIILSGLAYAQGEEAIEEAAKRGMVLVEPLNVIVTSDDSGDFALKAYRDRRPTWGATTSLGYSSYQPSKYEPDFAPPAAFASVYGSAEFPLLEILITVKRNMALGSLGAEVGVGYYSNTSSDKNYGDSTLTLMPVRFGGVFALDALSPQPYFVPYIAGGMYTMVFNESLGGNSHNGNTQVAPYFHGGVAFTLDWIDRYGATTAYRESSVQSTYAYVEAQGYMPAGAEADGDFSSDVNYAAGLRIEF